MARAGKLIDMLKTKCILAPCEASDGLRISVMSRHSPFCIDMSTLDDVNGALAPPRTLVGDYYKRGIQWDSYAEKYSEYLKTDKARDALYELIELAKNNTVTILCIESDPEFCHRRLIAEECKLLCPELEVIVKLKCPRCRNDYEGDAKVCPRCEEDLYHERMQEEEDFYRMRECYTYTDDGFCDGFAR